MCLTLVLCLSSANVKKTLAFVKNKSPWLSNHHRNGSKSKEQWEDFAKDYVAIMPGVTGKKPEQIANASKILLNKFQQVKTNKPVLALLKEQLGIYANSSPNAEQYSDCISFLVEKADNFLSMDDAQLLANL